MGETDTDNTDIEYIDDSVGEPCWHMRAPGAAFPGLPKGWSPPREPDNWGGYVPRINSGAPLEDDIDNPGHWNLYSYTTKYEKKKYIHHQNQPPTAFSDFPQCCRNSSYAPTKALSMHYACKPVPLSTAATCLLTTNLCNHTVPTICPLRKRRSAGM